MRWPGGPVTRAASPTAFMRCRPTGIAVTRIHEGQDHHAGSMGWPGTAVTRTVVPRSGPASLRCNSNGAPCRIDRRGKRVGDGNRGHAKSYPCVIMQLDQWVVRRARPRSAPTARPDEPGIAVTRTGTWKPGDGGSEGSSGILRRELRSRESSGAGSLPGPARSRPPTRPARTTGNAVTRMPIAVS